MNMGAIARGADGLCAPFAIERGAPEGNPESAAGSIHRFGVGTAKILSFQLPD